MTREEEDVLQCLTELDQAAKGMATANPKPNLKSLILRLDELTRAMPKDADPNLLHFLHRKSYQKALELLMQKVTQ